MPFPQLQGAPPLPSPSADAAAPPAGAAAPSQSPAAGLADLQWADVGGMTHASCLPLVPYVHPLLRPLFVTGMVIVLAAMVAAGDAGRQLGAWHAFFLVPRMLFWTGPDLPADPAATPHRDGDTRLNYGVLRYRLERFAAGDYGRLLEEAQAAEDARRAALEAAQSERSRGRSSSPSAAARLASAQARCLQQYQAGAQSRAMDALQRTDTTAPATEATAEEMRGMFPPAEEEDEELSAQLASFVPARRILISHEALLGALCGMARKSAGGLSGMTTDCMLDPLLDSGVLRGALLPVLQLLADGALPAAAVPLLADCRLIGLLKATGKLRPIAMGEWLRRLTSRLLLRAHLEPVRAYLEPVQLGVGTPGGVETAARAAQAFMSSPMGEGRVLVTVDLRDAFQRVSRAAFFRVLLGRSDLGGLVPFVRLLYSGPSTMWYRVGEGAVGIACAAGTQQGCVFGSCLFALAIQEALLWLRGEADFAVAIADDISFAARPEEAARILDGLTERLAEVGGEVHLAKCAALMLGDEERVPQELRDRGLRCVDYTTLLEAAGGDGPVKQRLGVPYLGVGVGMDAYLRAQLTAQLERPPPPDELSGATEEELEAWETTEYFEEGRGSELRRALWCLRQLAPIHLQCAVQLLRRCVLPRFDYLLRCLWPGLTRDAAAAFDDLAADCVWDMLAVPRQPRDSPAAQLLRLPLRCGGAGVCSRALVQRVAYAAASVDSHALLAALHPELAAHLALPTTEAAHTAAVDALLADEDLLFTIDDVPMARVTHPLTQSERAVLRAAAYPPPAAAAAAAAPRRRLGRTQSTLVSTSTDSAHTTYLELIASDPAAQAQHRSACGALGTAWMDAPGVGDTALDTATVRMELLVLLGLPLDSSPAPEDGGCVRCCCGALVPPGEAARHLDSCGGGPAGGNTTTLRHHDMQKGMDPVYYSMPGARRTGVAREPRPGEVCTTGKPDRAYPPLRLPHPHNTTLITDTVVTDPCNQTALDNGSAVCSGAAAEAAAKSKHSGWLAKNPLRPALTRFVPLAVETHGAVNKGVLDLLQTWARGKASAEVLAGAPDPGEAGDAGARVQRRAAQFLTGWLRVLSAHRVRAVNAHRQRLLGYDTVFAARRAAALVPARQFGLVPPEGEVGGPGFDDSAIYVYLGARSCRHRLRLEGGYDGVSGSAWRDPLEEMDSGAMAEDFLAGMGLRRGGEGGEGSEGGAGAGGAEEGAGLADEAEESRRGGLVQQ